MVARGDPGTPPVRGKGEAHLVQRDRAFHAVSLLPDRADTGPTGEESTVPTDSLPDRPDIEQLKGNAKSLRDLVRAGVDGAVALVRDHHPRLAELTSGTPDAIGFKLADAQLTLARHYGFVSWPRLRRHVGLVNRLTRSPHEQATGGPLIDDDARADELLRLACLNYGADSRARWERSRRLVADHPQLSRRSLFTAAAVGDVAAAGEILARDAAAASVEGGPFRWPPLLYLTYSRFELPGDTAGAGRDAVAVARKLLEHGADPNAGFLWDGLPSPFTALTGVFGRGEQAAPPHRDELTLARVLLEAGAEANDSQTIYNRGAGDIARDDTDFLELLLDFGLGRGDGGPWHRMLSPAHQTPVEIAAEALQHAAESGLVQRARLLLSRGADPNEPGTHPGYRGRSPYAGAVLHGNLEVAAMLAAVGADTSGVDVFGRFVGACLAGDGAAVDDALGRDPGLLDRARAERGDLVARATEMERPAAIELLVALGFDVNARHRTTALHEAAWRGNVAIVTLLVGLGADPTIVDAEHDSTPRGWAAHGGHTAVVELLDRLAPRPRSGSIPIRLRSSSGGTTD